MPSWKRHCLEDSGRPTRLTEAELVERVKMDAQELKKEILSILCEGGLTLNILERKNKYGFELQYSNMYERPTLGLKKLMQLSKLFGTEEIDVDDFSCGGCETCDYGSDYGHTIQVYNPTQNYGEILSIIGDKKVVKLIEVSPYG